MKKSIIIIMVLFAVLLTGCNKLTKENVKGDEEEMDKTIEQETEEKESITLQLLQTDIDAGVTIQNSEVYKELDRMIAESPDIGLENDFSIFIVDIVDSGTENASLLLLGINRLDEAIENVSFNYTLGNEEGEFVWEGAEVNLSSKEAGKIKPNHAIPFSLGITPEQEAIIDSLEQENQVVKIENFSFESAE